MLHSNSSYDNIIRISSLGILMKTVNVRRYDIDWLRVILFGLLIPFHVAIGVYWSTYGAEINPNIDELSEKDELEFVEESNDYTAESISFTSMILHWMHQLRLLNANAVPIPDIMNKAASLHWCIQCKIILVKEIDSAV